MNKKIGKHIDTFRQKMLNVGLFNRKFLIVYQITNFKAIANFDYINRIKSNEKISEWKSPIYSYIQKAKTKYEARELFDDKWNELANYEPKPKLEIISIQKIRKIRENSDKIQIY